MIENKNKLILMDGAVGTSLWEKSEDKVPVWHYNIENPAIVTELHREYLSAGSQIILANTFGANRGNVKSSPYTVEQVVRIGVRLAKEAVGDKAKVALAAGPLSTLLEPYGDLSEEEATEIYQEQIGAGMSEGADLIYLQTFIDVEMMHIAAKVANQYGVPLLCSLSFDASGHTLMGQSVADVVKRLSDLRVDAIGLNCSLGPSLALPVVKQFFDETDLPVIFKPNAGKPMLVDGKSEPGMDIEAFVNDIIPAVECGVTYIGGCCGANAAYIRVLGARLGIIK
jgi:5-methyltetrahydrofolate--homocysteine methyltransferase